MQCPIFLILVYGVYSQTTSIVCTHEESLRNAHRIHFIVHYLVQRKPQAYAAFTQKLTKTLKECENRRRKKKWFTCMN